MLNNYKSVKRHTIIWKREDTPLLYICLEKWLSTFTVFVIMKGAGNIKYGDIENWEIKKTGTSKMKQREYREKNNGNMEIKIENGEIENVVRNPFLNNTSIPVC